MENKFKTGFVSILLALVVVLSGCAPQSVPATSSSPVPSSSATSAVPSALSAVLSEITGKVDIKQSGQNMFTPANADSFLDENGQALTGGDGRVRLDLSTGTIVRVAPTSLFTLTLNQPAEGSLKTRFQVAWGKLFIILNGGSLEVETPTGTAAVRGSYMSVNYDPNSGEVRITCLEGHCSLTDTAGNVVDITTGQTAVITGSGQSPQVGTMTDQDIQDWLDNCPEARLVMAALTGVRTASPIATDIPLTPTTTLEVVNPPLELNPPIKKPTKPAKTEPTPAPSLTPTKAPSLTPTVVIGNLFPSTSSVVGQPLTLTINVLPSSGGPTPTGTIYVTANGTTICSAPLSAGTATCVGGIPAAGSPSLIAKYLGDSDYLAAQSAALGYYVAKASTTTAITSQTPNPSLVGAAVAFVATVDSVAPGAGLPTGSVTFTDGTDSCIVTSAPWTCSISFTTSGSRLVTAIYSGDANFNNSISDSTTQDVMLNTDSQFLNVTGPMSVIFSTLGECSQPYSVQVLDVNGISSVNMEYRLVDSIFVATDIKIPLTKVGANTWQGTIIVPAIAMDTIYWRFVAVDGSAIQTFFGGVTPYTAGYTGGSVSSYYFGLASTSPSCIP